VSVDDEDLEAAVRRITGGRMADVVIEATAAGPEIINTSLALLRKHGILLLASRKGAPVASFDADRLMAMQIRAYGTRGHSYEAVELALRAMEGGRFPLERMCSHTIGLDQIDHALRMVGGETAERSIHVTVDPWK
jgi:threonine dehydrogenase-like Zn-dependent dehydrogenase